MQIVKPVVLLLATYGLWALAGPLAVLLAAGAITIAAAMAPRQRAADLFARAHPAVAEFRAFGMSAAIVCDEYCMKRAFVVSLRPLRDGDRVVCDTDEVSAILRAVLPLAPAKSIAVDRRPDRTVISEVLPTAMSAIDAVCFKYFVESVPGGTLAFGGVAVSAVKLLSQCGCIIRRA